MEEKKMTYKDAIEKSASDSVLYRNVLRQMSKKDLEKAMKLLRDMPNTRMKLKFIEQELRMREKGEPMTSGGFPKALLDEWDRVTSRIRRRVKKWDSTSESTAKEKQEA